VVPVHHQRARVASLEYPRDVLRHTMTPRPVGPGLLAFRPGFSCTEVRSPAPQEGRGRLPGREQHLLYPGGHLGRLLGRAGRDPFWRPRPKRSVWVNLQVPQRLARSRLADLFGRPARVPRAGFKRREALSEVGGGAPFVHQVLELVGVLPYVVQLLVAGGGPAGVFDVDPALVAAHALVGGHAALRPVLEEEVGAPGDRLAPEKRREGAAVHVRARAYARPLAERRRQVYVKREVGQPHASAHVGTAHEERDVYVLLVGRVFAVDHGVLAVAVAVVRGEDEVRVVQLALLLEPLHDVHDAPAYGEYGARLLAVERVRGPGLLGCEWRLISHVLGVVRVRDAPGRHPGRFEVGEAVGAPPAYLPHRHVPQQVRVEVAGWVVGVLGALRAHAHVFVEGERRAVLVGAGGGEEPLPRGGYVPARVAVHVFSDHGRAVAGGPEPGGYVLVLPTLAS